MAPTPKRAKQIAEATRLRAQGLTHREIAEHLGVQRPTVTKMLNPAAAEWNRRQEAKPERQAAKRAWANEHDRRPCADCGRPRGVGAQRGSATDLCRDCWRASNAAARIERGHEIERLWAAGLSLKEIAARIGKPAGSLAVEMHALRALGFDLPYRRRPSKQ